MLNISVIIMSLLVGFAISLLMVKKDSKQESLKKEKTAEDLLIKAKDEAKKIKEESFIYVEKRKESIKHGILKKEERSRKIQNSLKQKEDFLNKRTSRLEQLKVNLTTEEKNLLISQEKEKNNEKEILIKLTKKTGLDPKELKEQILIEYRHNLEKRNEEKTTIQEELLKESADKRAKKIITGVIQRMCSPTSVETRAVHVTVPRDHIKGKILGRGGKNVKIIEEILDVHIVFNDLPNTISISAFQLVNRKIAQKTIENLVKVKGDISHDIIKNNIKKAEEVVNKELYKIGKSAAEKMRIDNNDEKFYETLGRLKYRTSYGQNIMLHSMEVGWAAQMLASEIGLDKKVSRVAGFLHDVGKAIDQDPNVKDAHDELSKEIMEKHGFSWEEVHAAWTHHDAIPQETAEALIVKAADAISASRPGARQESFDKYIERMTLLTETANTFKGVKKAYAISAGREVRVYVDPENIKDNNLRSLAKQLAEKIEEDVVYPGKIKVNAIRRTKHTEIAK